LKAQNRLPNRRLVNPGFRSVESGAPCRPLCGSRKPTPQIVKSRQGRIFETAPVEIHRKSGEKFRSDFGTSRSEPTELTNSEIPGYVDFPASTPSTRAAARQAGHGSKGPSNAVSMRPHLRSSVNWLSRNPDLSRDFSSNLSFGFGVGWPLRHSAPTPSASAAVERVVPVSLGLLNAVSMRPHSTGSIGFPWRNPDLFGISQSAKSTDF